MNTSTTRGLYWCLTSVLLVSYAQLLLKQAMQLLPALPPDNWRLLFAAGYQPPLMLTLGLLAYAISMICWFFALRRLPLGQSYPLLSLSYVLVYILSATLPWMQESITWTKTVGVLLILAGVYLVKQD